MDVQLTRDGHHVLSHREKVTAGTNQALAVSEHTLVELKQVDLGSSFAARFAGERLLTLEECLTLTKGKLNLSLDCKTVDPEKLVKEVLDAGMERQVIVYDSIPNLHRIDEFAHGRLALMAKWHPDVLLEPWVRSNDLPRSRLTRKKSRPL